VTTGTCWRCSSLIPKNLTEFADVLKLLSFSQAEENDRACARAASSAVDLAVDFRQQPNIKKRSLRGVVIGAVLILCIGTYAWFFGFQTLMLISVRWSYRNHPAVHATPVPLTDNSVAPAQGSNISCFGYQFEVPWQDVDSQNIQRKVMVLIPFRSGLTILVGHGSTHDLVDTAMNSAKISPEALHAAYGDKAAQSDYEFLKLLLNATPESIKLLDSSGDVGRRAALLVLKSLILLGDPGIFDVEANEFKGFQYGDPSKRPRRVGVVLYSASGGVEISIARKDSTPLTISQADINRIIRTVRYSPVDVPQ